MKKKKTAGKVGEALLEGLVEIVFMLVCFGVGTFIFGLLGVELDSTEIGEDAIILIGIIAIVVISLIICSIMQLFKKKAGTKTNSQFTENNNSSN